jgi:hypothetical protein
VYVLKREQAPAVPKPKMHQETIPLQHMLLAVRLLDFSFVVLNEWFYTHEWKHSSGRSLFWNPALSWFEYKFCCLVIIAHTVS